MGAPQPMSRMINWALADQMLTYQEIVLAGEDIGRKGGVYGVTQKLQARFGAGRVIDTFFDEQSVLGFAIGMAQNGFLPIPEIQFLAYLHNAEDQIRGETATLPFFSNGQYANPMVVRNAGLGYQKGFGGHFHNDNSIAVLRDIPGVIVACPSTCYDAALMLRECVRLETLMQERLIGGQIIYPFMTEDWGDDPARRAELMALVARIDAAPDQFLTLSIDYGGRLVLAGDEAGLAAFEAAVPKIQERFPMRLVNHAAFHTALQAPVAEAGRERLSQDLFGPPSLPLVDGRGAIWWPQATDVAALRQYTLGFQVTQPYDFTGAVRSAAREFAPDVFIATGPGSTRGVAIAQSLIIEGWRGMKTRADFVALQRIAPLVISMGVNEGGRLFCERP